jgi:uncharacterized membrane protein HdeD (DUF308 family)
VAQRRRTLHVRGHGLFGEVEGHRFTDTEQGDFKMTTTETTSRKMHIFLTRGVIAVAWAAVFAAAAGSLTTEVTIGAGILLVIYPLIDVVASVIDARTQQGSAQRVLRANAALSAVAALALGLAATGSVASVFVVFGIWAAVSGAAQLVTALRRRAELGIQLPMLLAGGVSVLLGIVFVAASATANPMLRMLAIYAATGGVDFMIEAWLLSRRRHNLSTLPVAA